jgi:hypothetical protein
MVMRQHGFNNGNLSMFKVPSHRFESAQQLALSCGCDGKNARGNGKSHCRAVFDLIFFS